MTASNGGAGGVFLDGTGAYGIYIIYVVLFFLLEGVLMFLAF